MLSFILNKISIYQSFLTGLRCFKTRFLKKILQCFPSNVLKCIDLFLIVLLILKLPPTRGNVSITATTREIYADLTMRKLILIGKDHIKIGPNYEQFKSIYNSFKFKIRVNKNVAQFRAIQLFFNTLFDFDVCR